MAIRGSISADSVGACSIRANPDYPFGLTGKLGWGFGGVGEGDGMS